MRTSKVGWLCGLLVGGFLVGQAMAAPPKQVIGRPMPGPGGMVMPNLTPPSPLGQNISPYGPNNQHMPGWDWQRTYPWSPYNYGRNPYNPAIMPYYSQPYPYGMPQGYQPQNQNYPDGAMVPNSQAPQVVVPHPTGQLRSAPPDAGVIELRIPDSFGTVMFDGVKTSSIGTTRYYVTPALTGGKPQSYTISATWNQNGQPTSGTKTVQVSAGHFSVVDFTASPALK